ncbi:endonuclease [Thermobifida halotolerans]|uniref:Endonuclease n=1 Tax=Thermobifida halotolerans TaxID=483545 RepID=A0AA97LYM6_9ACTN|nr:endonuclease [Thermobifida halotolerans]UOE20250.1 endonuclease [Thermobifida halotolerans]
MRTDAERAGRVLRLAGRLSCSDAGIRLADRPAPLWQLLVLANLLSARISADIATAAARELNAAGGTTAKGMLDLDWQERVDALGRGHYVRYDESTATRLGDCARKAVDEYGGDLRRLPGTEQRDVHALEKDLRGFPGIGPTGANIFCREVQHVWAWLRPYVDPATRDGAERVGLPGDADALARLVDGDDLAPFLAGLVRVGRDRDLARRVTDEES